MPPEWRSYALQSLRSWYPQDWIFRQDQSLPLRWPRGAYQRKEVCLLGPWSQVETDKKDFCVKAIFSWDGVNWPMQTCKRGYIKLNSLLIPICAGPYCPPYQRLRSRTVSAMRLSPHNATPLFTANQISFIKHHPRKKETTPVQTLVFTSQCFRESYILHTECSAERFIWPAPTSYLNTIC